MAITPYLYYQDVDAAMKFLSKAFGFRKYGRPMQTPDGKTSHAAMQFGEDIVMMGRPPKKYRNPKQLRQTTQSLYVNVENVDKHLQRAKKAGATIIEDAENTEYGHRRYRAADPEGHEWAFAQELRTTQIKTDQEAIHKTAEKYPTWYFLKPRSKRPSWHCKSGSRRHVICFRARKGRLLVISPVRPVCSGSVKTSRTPSPKCFPVAGTLCIPARIENHLLRSSCLSRGASLASRRTATPRPRTSGLCARTI